MGFDNECIVNIQSLAGEYFCPVCRLLVYPNEAMQSQCTHLYCKPCLTYVVGTTRACPYDGYLVTEPDSKPLLESNKALADTIGKIAVRCLYHRSGCQWQGPLSDCTTHCSGCAYGNSAVVCNRCAVQIVHRQVQEHAQTCPGVQPQATQAEGTQNVVAAVAAAPANGGQAQVATQSVATNSVANTSQTGAAPATAHDPNLQASVNPPVHGVAQGAVLTPEQLYQQQYYQQYPGYDPYQQAYQNYYPYPQQPQAYLQPQQAQQPAIQSQAPVQAQAPPPQSQGQAQSQSLQNVNPNYQTHQAVQPPAQMMPQGQQGYPQPYPQPQSHAQAYPGGQTHQQPPPTHPQSQQIPQFPQPQPQVQQHHPQMPPQSHSQAHPQHQNIPQQPHRPLQSMSQALNPNAQPETQRPLTHAVMGNHSYPQPQAHQQMPIGAQLRPNLHPQGGPIPQLPPHPQGQYAQQFPPMGVPQSLPPVQNQQLAPHGQVPGVPPAQQRPVNPYGQQAGHLAMQPIQLMPQQHMPHQQAFSGQASGPVQNQLHPHGQHVQLPPPPPLHSELHHQLHSGLQPQQPQSHYVRPVMGNHEAQPHAFAQPAAGYPGQAQGRPAHLGANQHLPSHNHQLKTNNQFQTNDSSSQGIAEKERNGLASASGLGTESVEANNLKVEGDIKLGDNEDEMRRAENTSELPADNGGKSFEQKDDTDAFQKEKVTVDDNSNESGANTGVQVVETAHTSEGSANHEERKPAQSHVQGLVNGSAPPSHPFPPADQIWGHHLPMQYASTHQQRPAGPPMLQPALPPGLPHHPQPFNMHPDHVQHPPFGRPPSHFVPHDRSFELQHSRGPRMPSTFPDPWSRYLDGPSPGTKSQVWNSKDSVGTDSSLTAGMQDERFNPSTDRVPRPFDKEPGSGALDASRFLPPYHIGGLNEAEDRVPGFGGNHIDRYVSRSPGRENAGFPPRDCGGLPGFPRNQSDIRSFEGYESRPFDEGPRPFSHFLRGEQLEGPRFLRGGEFQDPRKLPGHMHVGDPTGFGAFPAPGRRGDLTGLENLARHRPFSEPFSGNISGHLNFGEPGFRSSYPTAGGLDPFDNPRKRLPPNNGWCRICKVECEGVEGLELHSQTREHQDMAMDMVRNIKLQNSKKLKLSSDLSSLEEPSKRRGPGNEVHNSRR